jgi:predicted CoA-binding protein
MTDQKTVQDFLAQKTIAVVGVSRSGEKYGNQAYRRLKSLGYRVYPIHPNAEQLEGDQAYPSLTALPEKPGGVLIVVPPAQTESVVQDVAKAGIRRVWMQPGAESPTAIRFCKENNIAVVHSTCILTLSESVGDGNSDHVQFWGLGELPK